MHLFKALHIKKVLVVLIACFLLPAVALSPKPAAAISVYDYFTIAYEMQFSKTTVQIGESFTVTVTGTATLIKPLEVAGITFTPGAARVNSHVVASHAETGGEVTLNPSFGVTISPFPTQVGQVKAATEVVSLIFPAGSVGGSYQVEGVVDEWEVSLPILGWVDPADFGIALPTTQPMGTVTLDAPGLPAGGGGGGGSTSTATPTSTASTTPGTTNLSAVVNADGKLTKTLTAQSADGKTNVSIQQGTKAVTADNKPLTDITIKTVTVQPAPPEAGRVLSVVYDFGPDGATFEPPINLTIPYDESMIPEGLTEDQLTVAFFDPKTGKWTQLSGCIIDKTNNTITVPVNHFTSFSVVAYTRPAEFVLSNLSVTPAQVNIGEQVTIKALLENKGDFSGNLEVIAKIGDSTISLRTVSLAAHASEQMTFTGTAQTGGTFTVKVNELIGTLVVGKPATFVAGQLSITPSQVQAGQEVTISTTITNIGDASGTGNVSLKIGDSVVSAKPVTLNAGEKKTEKFTVSRNIPGIYSVDINGLHGEFSVVSSTTAPPETSTPIATVSPAPTPLPPRVAINWVLVGSIFAAYAVLTAGIFWFLRRRRRAGL